MNTRETQFAGFAKALWDELPDLNVNSLIAFDEWSETSEKIIAQRAYDLVRHALYCDNINSAYWPGHPLYGQASDIYEKETAQKVSDIPDLTELPEVSQ